MNVKLKFYGLGINDNYQANVSIYEDGMLIYDGQTYNGELIICLNSNVRYRIIATSYGDIIDTYFSLTGKDVYYFFFNRSFINKNQSITFILRDYFYNLPIERGELILWQKL